MAACSRLIETIYRLVSQQLILFLTNSLRQLRSIQLFTYNLFLASCHSAAGRRRWSFIHIYLDYIYKRIIFPVSHLTTPKKIIPTHHTTSVTMVAYRILFLAGAAAALPLNINLGAYSPALVVGKMLSIPLLAVPELLLIIVYANR